jgi:hypothetical protein
MHKTINIVETRKIPFKNGQILTVEMSQRFIDHLRQHFGLLESQPLENEHIQAYVLESVNNAIVKAELELKDAESAAGID